VRDAFLIFFCFLPLLCVFSEAILYQHLLTFIEAFISRTLVAILSFFGHAVFVLSRSSDGPAVPLP
jgi:hypothetical protein